MNDSFAKAFLLYEIDTYLLRYLYLFYFMLIVTF